MPLAKLERLLQTGAYYQVRKEANRLLREAELSPEAQGRILSMACSACLELNDPYAAVSFGEQAVKQLQAAGDATSLWRAHLDLGCAQAEVGEAYGAEASLKSFLALLPGNEAANRWEGVALGKLAALYRQRRRWHEAVDALERACRCFDRQGEHGEKARATLELAWSYLMLGLPALAAPLFGPVESYLTAHPDPGLSADLICRRALLYRLEGDLVASSRLCQELFMPGRPGTTTRHKAEAAWILGENALSLNQLHEARAFGEEALTHAAEANWPGLINLSNDLRRRTLVEVPSGEE